MKHNTSALFFVAVLLVASAAHATSQSLSADAVLLKAAKKLVATKHLGYTYTRELNYASEDYLSKSTASSYIDMSPVDGLFGFRYQFADDDYIAIYNGTESFIGVKKKKTLIVTNNPPRNMLESSSFLYNSPLTLRYVLPKIAADAKIPKKLTTETVDGRRVHRVEFSLHKASISGLGDIRESRNDRMSIYRVTIDARTFFPTEVLLTNDKNKDFTKTTFANITQTPAARATPTWYFSNYLSEYKLEQPKEKKLLEVGQAPPSFVLTEFGSTSQIALDKYNGKVVLLEFWIAHCGFCIAAVPKLNQISQKFVGTDLEFFSINLHDSDATIASFKKRNSPIYPILSQGESAGDAYGVGAYPAIVLIGKDGKVSYSSLGLFETELEAAIKASLGK